MAAGQVQVDHAEALADPAAGLEQAQGAELEVRYLALRQPAPEGIEEPIGGAVQQEADLVGPEAPATQPIGAAALLEVFDAQLGVLAAPAVPGVERRRRVGAGGDHQSAE